MTKSSMWAFVGLLMLALVAPGSVRSDGFGERPPLIDGALKGWVAPLQTILFQVGCGELYGASAIYLGSGGVLSVVSRSKATLRRFELDRLQRFANRLAGALSPVAADLWRRKIVGGVVMTFYAPHLKGNVMELEIYESCLPISPAGLNAPVTLCLSEYRKQELALP